MLKFLLCVAYICFSVSGLTLVKIGSTQEIGQGVVVPIIDITISKWSLVGVICYGISFCLYLGVISKFDLGVIIPIIGGIVNILILIVSCCILKEKMTMNMIIGALIIIVGIVIMNINKK